ncbi:MAG: SH3 domain-containing protein [Sphingomicrobium sp.]
MIGLAIAAALAAATPAQLPPVDRCRDDAAFSQFRAQIEDAVTRKDPAALRRLAADDIRSNFGGDGLWEEFAATWALGDPQKSALWKEIQEVMALGCAKTEDNGRVFPGMFEDMGDDADPFELLVVRPGAGLRSAPDKNASAVTTLEWASTVQLEAPESGDWVKVQVPGGPSGWVETDLVISPLDYRLVSEIRDGHWRITAFIAGD